MGAHAAPDRLHARLVEHLAGWVGGWPPRDPALVAGNARNARPGVADAAGFPDHGWSVLGLFELGE